MSDQYDDKANRILDDLAQCIEVDEDGGTVTTTSECTRIIADALRDAARVKDGCVRDTYIVDQLQSLVEHADIFEELTSAVLGNNEPDHTTRGLAYALRELMRERAQAAAAARKEGE